MSWFNIDDGQLGVGLDKVDFELLKENAFVVVTDDLTGVQISISTYELLNKLDIDPFE